jgi:hypothetical protein
MLIDTMYVSIIIGTIIENIRLRIKINIPQANQSNIIKINFMKFTFLL